MNSNSLFCISKYIIVGQNHISNPSHITLRSIVCIEIISTHSSVGLHGSVHSWKDRTRITPLTTHLLPDSESRLAITIEPALIIMGSIFKDYQDSERNCEPQLLPCLSQGEKKSEFEFTFLYFKVYYQKSTPLAILLTIEFLINIRSQNLTYSLYLSLMTLRTSLTSVASNVKLCQELPLWSILLWDLEEV